MKTKDTGGDTVTFQTVCQSSPVWGPNGYPTTDSKFTNPVDLVIMGDYSYGELGWDTDDSISGDAIPDLGRAEIGGDYDCSYVISVQGRNRRLLVDCYGFLFQGDVDITYDYDDNKFFWTGTSTEVTGILNLHDNPEYLQPTPPRNFICTNAGQTGQNPHFAWNSPLHPVGVSFKYDMYRGIVYGSAS